MADSNTLSFDSVHHESSLFGPEKTPSPLLSFKAFKSHGKFKLTEGGVGWKEAATGQVVTIKADDIKQASWSRGFHSGFTLFLDTPTGRSAFHGFPGDARDQLESFIQDNYKQASFQSISLDRRGWNWGQVQVTPEDIQFIPGSSETGDGRPALTLPLHAISGVSISGRSELCVDIQDPFVSEIRFHVPGKMVLEDEDADDPNNIAENEEQRMEKELLKEQVDAAAALCDQIKAAAGLEEVATEAIYSLSDVSCLVPRGRYDIEFSANIMRMHGKTYEHRINYGNILKLIVLPKADDYHVLVVVHLEPPLRHGQTKYPFLIFSTPKDEMIEVEASSPEEAIVHKLSAKYEGPTFEVLASLIRQLAGQKIVSPAPVKFAASPLPCVRCTVRANEGHLYPLDRGLIYLPKPTLLIPYADISSVILGRSGSGMGNPRSFDLRIVGKSMDHQFCSLPKEDLLAVSELFSSRNITLIDEAQQQQQVVQKKRKNVDDDASSGHDAPQDDIDSESTDEDYNAGQSQDSDDVDEEFDEDYESDEDDSVSGEDEEDSEEEEGEADDD